MGIIPMEIIFECILSKLPVKSLIRFKCVSKSFLAEISSPKFIKQHHHNAISSNSNRLLILPIGHQGVYVYDLDSPPHSTPPLFCPYPKPISFSPFMKLVAICEGYLLIARGLNTLNELAFLNPSTRTYREIPNERLPHKFHRVVYGMWHCLDEFYDEHRVVRLANFDGIEGLQLQVMVYNTTTNTWKEIKSTTVVNIYIAWSDSTPVLVQNHLLHLLFFNRGDDLNDDQIKRIGCFDMKAEQWANNVEFPDVLWDKNGIDFSLHSPYDLGALDEQLCFKGLNVIESSFDLWVMKEYGVKESWVKLMSLRVNSIFDGPQLWPEFYHPVAYNTESPHELLFMKGRYGGKFYWYNLKDEEDFKAEFPPPMNRQHKWGLIAYICKGSLLNFPGGQPITVSVEEYYDDQKEEDK